MKGDGQMIRFRRVLAPIAALACLLGLAACQTTVTGQGGAAASGPEPEGREPEEREPAQLEFRKVLRTEPDRAAPGTAPPTNAGQAEVDRTKAARQHLDPADAGSVQAALNALDCAAPDPLKGHDDPALPLVTCDRTSPAKYLLDRAFLTGAEVEQARAELDANAGGWVIRVSFTGAGGKAWADFTAANVGDQVAIVLDAEVVSAPTIQEAILAGTTVISGRFTREQAEQLAERLGSR